MKHFVQFLLVPVCLFATGSTAWGQASGDYRSVASGYWDAITTWETFDGSGWVPASVKPGPTNNVYIQATHVDTLRMNEACNDIHLASASSPNYGRVATVTYTLEVYGKIRTYTGVIPGTNVSGPVNPPFTKSAAGSSGLIKIVGNSRNVTSTGEFGSFSATAPSINASIEIAVNPGQTATFQTGAKFASWVITSGTLDFTGRLAVDFGTTPLGNVTVSAGAALVSNQSGTIMSRTSTGVGGVFTLDGTLVLKRPNTSIGMTTINFNGTVQYDSAGPQTLLTAITGGASPNTYNNLTLSNAGAKSIGSNITVNGTLLFSGSATAQLDNYNLTLGPSATISGSSATNYVIASSTGELRKTFTADGPFTYPVGDAASYSPVALTLSGAAYSSAYVGVKLNNIKHPGNASTTDYLNRYWTVTASGITGGSYDANFVYVDGDIAGTESNMVLGQFGTQWNVVGTCVPATNTLSAVGLSSFSDFTGGEAVVLPIQLSSFMANRLSTNAVLLDWVTVSEINNYGFEVQRSSQRSSGFTSISSLIPGHGTTNERHTYSYTDNNAPAGPVYYRLKQIDLDGTIHCTEPTHVDALTGVKEVAPLEFTLKQNYPNPFNPSTEIRFSVDKTEHATVTVYNALGQKVETLFDDVAEAGQYYRVRFEGTAIASGVYFYRLQTERRSDLKRFVLLK